jgi:hypothetical protein
MRLLVCGSRDWSDYDRLAWMLDRLASTNRIEVIIHGGARGADLMAGAWARKRGIDVEPHPAPWHLYPPARRWVAGQERNHEMLESKPDLVVGFKAPFDWTMKRGGTEHMVRIASEAGVPTLVVGR